MLRAQSKKKVWLHFWAFFYFPSIFVSAFMPEAYFLVCGCFVVQFEIKGCDNSSFILLSQDYFGYFGSFVFSYKFQNNLFQLYLKKITIVISMGIVLNLSIALRSMVILKMLILTVHECNISFHLFVSISTSLISVFLDFLVQIQLGLFLSFHQIYSQIFDSFSCNHRSLFP